MDNNIVASKKPRVDAIEQESLPEVRHIVSRHHSFDEDGFDGKIFWWVAIINGSISRNRIKWSSMAGGW